jgi:hypothetical protein
MATTILLGEDNEMNHDGLSPAYRAGDTRS